MLLQNLPKGVTHRCRIVLVDTTSNVTHDKCICTHLCGSGQRNSELGTNHLQIIVWTLWKVNRCVSDFWIAIGHRHTDNSSKPGHLCTKWVACDCTISEDLNIGTKYNPIFRDVALPRSLAPMIKTWRNDPLFCGFVFGNQKRVVQR